MSDKEKFSTTGKETSQSVLSSDNEEVSPRKSSGKLSLKNLRKPIISDSDDSETEVLASQPSKNETTPVTNLSLTQKKGWVGPDMKLNLKPLGFDKRLDRWIESTKNDPIVSSSSLPVSLKNYIRIRIT